MANAWLLRANIEETIIPLFKKYNIVAIGWGDVGDLSGKTKEDIKNITSETYNLTGVKLGNSYASINMFVNDMQEGDIVVIPDGEEVYLVEITGGYVFNDTPEFSIAPHTRTIEWKTTVKRDELPDELRRALRVMRTTASLSKHYDGFLKVINGSHEASKSKVIEVAYPLRSDFIVKFAIPNNMTANEANRLSKYISTLYFDEQ